MKSNIALQNKKSAIQKMQGKYRSDPFTKNFAILADLDAVDDDEHAEEEPSSGSKATSTKSQMDISDDMASEIFDKLTK